MHFEVYTKKKRRADWPDSTTPPTQYPCYELVQNDDWNDYGCYNWFSLWRFESREEEFPDYIGDLKIMTTREDTTIDALGSSFDVGLDSSFCSLGIGTGYYSVIHHKLSKEEAEELLQNLRDCVYTPTIREQFQEYSEFKNSLCRDQESEEALENGLLFLTDAQEDTAYRIMYGYTESFGNHNDVSFQANFQYRCAPYMRTMGIIGENGLGKTQLLSHLVQSLCSREHEGLHGETLFKGCVVLCSTSLDQYPEAIENSRIAYSRYSLEQRSDSTASQIKEAIEEIINKHPIHGLSISGEYRQCLYDVIGELTKNIITEEPARDNEPVGIVHYVMNSDEIDRVVHIMSSGQLHLFALITYLFSKSHLSTLFVLDEPEVHLHPHIMVLFMRVLAFVLNLYKSYAIIATHSPLIIREMVKRNVQIMERVNGDATVITPVTFDTFGEDVTTLYHKIFDYSEKDSYFYHIVQNLLKRKNYSDVIALLSRDMDLNLNARLIIRDLAQSMNKINA